MLYRKILLLALIQACGGSASVATCQATLSLFCTRRKKDQYEFFPTPQGYLSLVLAQDKRSLIQAGLLAEQEGFMLQEEGDYLTQLKSEDQEALLTKNDLSFFLGTTHEYHNVSPDPFIIIGIFYPLKEDSFAKKTKRAASMRMEGISQPPLFDFS